LRGKKSFRGLLFSLLLCLVVLSGCATKLPKTTPLASDRQPEAESLFVDFLQVPQPIALDADIRIGWDILGSKGGVDAVLQLQKPAFLRFSATDPLGRSLFIAVSDGAAFTMVDNRIGRIYQGKTDSNFWRSYVPESILAEDLFFFLSGSLPKVEMITVKTAQDSENAGFWYVWKDGRSMTHHVLLDSRSRGMRRHLLLDPQGDLVLDVNYSAYLASLDAGFNWPRHLQISGKAITGTLTVQVNKIYSHTQQAASLFRLTPPPHFTVEQVP
jgi:outer membrane lipoprotein-sorting protein